MKNLILITAFLISSVTFDTDWFQLFQADYFVNSEIGSDSNSGLYPWDAWQTISKVNSTTFSAGDRIGFNGTFSGTITVGQSGTAGNPITFKGYGDGATFTGFTTVTGWTKRSNTDVYVKYIPTTVTPEILTVNGVQYAMGRTPNADRYNYTVNDYYHIDNNIAGTVTSVSNYSGTVAGTILLTTSSAHGISTGNYVTLSLTPTTYNGNYTATVVNTTQFYVTKTYSATATGTVYNNMRINDSECNSAVTDWDGAEIVIRANEKTDWVRGIISSHSGTTLHYSNSGNNLISADYGYFIQNDLRTLDQFGEWYFNGTSDTLYFYGNPSGYTVKISTVDKLIDVNSKDYITVKNLTFTGANSAAVTTSTTTSNAYNLTVDKCNYDFNYTAIYGHQAPNMRITNNTILRSSDRGIYNHWNSDGYYIAHNTIDSTGLIIGAAEGLIDNKTMTAIYCGYAKQSLSSNKGIIEYNSVKNSGYYGISFGGDSAIARYNLVDKYCLLLADGGGIHKTGRSSGSDTTHYRHMEIVNNIILNGVDQTDAVGLPASTTNTQINGIYTDVYTFDIKINNNTVANSANGVYVLGVQNIEFNNNTFYNCDYGVKFHKRADAADLTLPIRNLTGSGNKIINDETGTKPLVSFKDIHADSLKRFGTFNNNYYSHVISNKTPFEQSVVYTKTNLSKAGWNTATGEDAGSYLTWNKGSSTIFDYNNTTTNKTVNITGTYLEADSTEYTTSYTLQPYKSIVLFKDTVTTIDIDSIYAAYPFNSDAQDSVASQDGTVSGATLTTGKFKNGYNFDADAEYVRFPINTSGLTTADSSYSISFWVKLDELPSVSGFSYYFISDIKSGSSYKMALQLNTSNTLVFQTRNTVPTAYTVNSATGAMATTGVWYHIVINVPSAGEIGQIYLNGTRTTGGSQNTFVGASRTSDLYFYAGSYTGTAKAGRMTIDDIIIRRCWTTADEAAHIYNSGTGRYYPFIGQ